MERLQKVIAQAGICSRRKAEELITEGKVSVNGVTITELGIKVNEKEVGLTWGEVEFIYNGVNQLPTATATGLVNNDVCSVTVTGEKVNVGEYEATASSLSNSNYKLPVNVTTGFEIKKAQLTVTANDEEVTYGDEAPSYTVTYNGTMLDKYTYQRSDDMGDVKYVTSTETSSTYTG